jgi:hypothetical protein
MEKIRKDAGLVRAFEDRRKYVQEAKELEREIANLKGAYDTSLLETIAKQKQGQANVAAVKKNIQQKTNALNALTRQIAVLDEKINVNEQVRVLWGKIQALQDKDRDSLKADLRRLNFWFQTLVSSHLLVVSFIPIFFKIIEMILDIIPKKLIKKIIDLLESLKLIAIWHYLVIALAVAVALFLIYIFQKKLFSREKLIERRISRSQCQNCGKQLPAGSPACPFCGFAQFKPCGACKKPTHVYGKYCRECGSAVS